MTIEREANGYFRKGSSGNPGGRPGMPEGLLNSIRELSPRAVEVIKECLESADERVRFVAAKEVLDRGYGRVAAASTVTVVADAQRVIDSLGHAKVVMLDKETSGGA